MELQLASFLCIFLASIVHDNMPWVTTLSIENGQPVLTLKTDLDLKAQSSSSLLGDTRCPLGRRLDIFCGRGGERCPFGSTCIIDPLDRFAFCCQEGGGGRRRCRDGRPPRGRCRRAFFGRSRCGPGLRCERSRGRPFGLCCPIGGGGGGLCPDGSTSSRSCLGFTGQPCFPGQDCHRVAGTFGICCAGSGLGECPLAFRQPCPRWRRPRDECRRDSHCRPPRRCCPAGCNRTCQMPVFRRG